MRGARGKGSVHVNSEDLAVALRNIGRRLVIPVLSSTLLLGAAAGSALAKCEMPDRPAICDEVVASVEFGSSGGTVRAGVETPIRVWIYRAQQPVEVSSVTLVFMRIVDSSFVQVEATKSGEAGMWRADVTLPASGGWTLVAEVDGIDGGLQRLSMDTVRVAEALAAPDQPGTPVSPINPSTLTLPIVLLVAALAAAVLGASALRVRSRRRVSAG
jgi:hypothetical protein